MNPPLAQDIMVTKLVTLLPDTEVAEAIRLLVKHSISGVPVVEGDGNYLGVFSEKCCMKLFDVIARFAKQQQVALPTLPDARQIMSTKLVTLSPDTDVVQAIGDLLDHRISGAPVVDSDGRFLGVFSEKTSMSVLVQAAYEQLPTTQVAAFMDTDLERTILEDVTFLECARMFRETPYRRLPVLRDDKLVGLISRRDVLRNSNELASMIPDGKIVLEGISDTRPTEGGSPPIVFDRVRHFLDLEAETITEDRDLLAIAKEFLHTPYRRFPVIRDGKLIGQVSRRDVLMATHRLMKITPQREVSPLYLSALNAAFHQQ